MDHEIAERRTPDPRIDAVEKASMTRKDIARVLEFTLTFEHAFPEIAKRGKRADHQTQATLLETV